MSAATSLLSEFELLWAVPVGACVVALVLSAVIGALRGRG